MKRSETFNEIAELYDRARPGYPDDLVQDIITLSGLPDAGRILEIGSGTGKATAPFAARGYSLLCIEPGRNLAAFAEAKFRDSPNVAIETTTFEAWPLAERTFDLAMAGQSLHWVSPEVGFSKTSAALKDDGWLALFWNLSVPVEDDLYRQIQAAYRLHAAGTAQFPEQGDFEAKLNARGETIRQSGFYQEPLIRQYPWSKHYPVPECLELLDTHSDHRVLPEANRQALFAALTEILSPHGGITTSSIAVLYLARKKQWRAGGA